MNKPPIKKKSWHKPTKPKFTSLNNVILNCFVSLPQFQWTRLYCKGQKRHSRQWAGSCYGDVLTQTRRVRPLKLLPRCFIMALHLQRTQQRQGSWINSNILVLLHSPECACDSSESRSLSLPSFFSFLAACPRLPPSSHSFFHFIPCHLSPRLTDAQPVFNGQGREMAN